MKITKKYYTVGTVPFFFINKLAQICQMHAINHYLSWQQQVLFLFRWIHVSLEENKNVEIIFSAHDVFLE